MKASIITASSLALVAPVASETILGAYIFHRHGDRTPKALAPTNLTSLGYQQVYTSGQYYRSKYIASDASSRILNLNTDIVALSQLAVTAPVDNVLQSSAQGFLQGLYPPVGSAVSMQTLANGSSVSAPLDGYQNVPVNIVSMGAGSAPEDNAWLQDASGCANAKSSSNNYFLSAEYERTLADNQAFFDELYPVVNQTFARDYVTFKNAYSVYDLINCATIQNTTIQSAEVLTTSNLERLYSLASTHEFNLAYNTTDTARAIAGAQLAGEILTYLNNTITSCGAKGMLGIQFGAYGTFSSFFGLANLTAASEDFTTVVNYASSLAVELYTDADTSSFPAADDLRVRFSFTNGSASTDNEPTVYPLFGQSETSLSWSDFVDRLNIFAVKNEEQWCGVCGSTSGTCAAYFSDGADAQGANGSGSEGGEKGGMSAVIGGVIGAMVTLAVVLGLQALFMVAGGFRLARKSKKSAAPVRQADVKA